MHTSSFISVVTILVFMGAYASTMPRSVAADDMTPLKEQD